PMTFSLTYASPPDIYTLSLHDALPIYDVMIDGWIMLPADAKEGVRYPLLVSIHGGPQGAYSVGMSLTFQYFAARGYAVFYCNPQDRKSTRLNSSHVAISYAVFCLKKKK